MQWHYAKQGRQFGPVDEAELFRLAAQGQIAPDDLVWNPSLGGEWAEASSIPNLISEGASSAPPPPAEKAEPSVVYEAGGTHNRDLMRMARASLATHWGLAVGVGLVYQVIVSAVSGFIPVVGAIASMIIAGPMYLGVCLVFLSLARRSETQFGLLFNGFNRFASAMCTYLLMSLYTFLWMLLLIIPGIIASYAYSMSFFILVDDPSIKANEAIAKSKAMMQGNKLKLFCMYWRFLGWALLCLLTFGIGFLWLLPYTYASMAHFYEDVKQQHARRAA